MNDLLRDPRLPGLPIIPTVIMSAQFNEEHNPLLAHRDTSNPYLYAARAIWERFLWDCRPESWRSRSRLRHLRNRHLQGRAVIVCNGPSLNQMNFDALGGIFTFGLNKINLLFERSAFRPSCITAVNPLVIEQNRAFYNETNIPLFLDTFATRFVKSRGNVTFVHSSEQPKMARDCSVSVHQGFTVTFVAMQLAFHMGFRDVALIGCDHNFSVKGQANRVVVSGDRDASHFDPRYFSGGQRWHLPDLSGSEYFYSLAGEHYAAFGGRIVNCTEGGKLGVFPRMPLDAWLQAEVKPA